MWFCASVQVILKCKITIEILNSNKQDNVPLNMLSESFMHKMEIKKENQSNSNRGEAEGMGFCYNCCTNIPIFLSVFWFLLLLSPHTPNQEDLCLNNSFIHKKNKGKGKRNQGKKK